MIILSCIASENTYNLDKSHGKSGKWVNFAVLNACSVKNKTSYLQDFVNLPF